MTRLRRWLDSHASPLESALYVALVLEICWLCRGVN